MKLRVLTQTIAGAGRAGSNMRQRLGRMRLSARSLHRHVKIICLKNCSGITVSDPSVRPVAVDTQVGAKKGNNHMLPKVIGLVFGLLAVGIFAWRFKETPLCRP